MPTIVQIKEKVLRLMEGGIKTTNSRLDDGYVYAIINDARAHVLRQDFIKSKRWSSQAVQTFYPEYESYYQNSVCYTRFRLPTAFIQGNSAQDGLVYFGSDTIEILRSQNFDRIKNRAEFNDFLNNSRTNDFSIPAILIEGLVATVMTKENMAENLMVVGVLDNPLALSTYNIDKDQYPISEDLIPMLYDVILNGTMKVVFARPTNTSFDAQNDMKGGTK